MIKGPHDDYEESIENFQSMVSPSPIILDKIPAKYVNKNRDEAELGTAEETIHYVPP